MSNPMISIRITKEFKNKAKTAIQAKYGTYLNNYLVAILINVIEEYEKNKE